MRASLGIRPPKFVELKAAREVMSDVGRLTLEDALELRVGGPHATIDDVALVLTSELTTCDK